MNDEGDGRHPGKIWSWSEYAYRRKGRREWKRISTLILSTAECSPSHFGPCFVVAEPVCKDGKADSTWLVMALEVDEGDCTVQRHHYHRRRQICVFAKTVQSLSAVSHRQTRVEARPCRHIRHVPSLHSHLHSPPLTPLPCVGKHLPKLQSPLETAETPDDTVVDRCKAASSDVGRMMKRVALWWTMIASGEASRAVVEGNSFERKVERKVMRSMHWKKCVNVMLRTSRAYARHVLLERMKQVVWPARMSGTKSLKRMAEWSVIAFDQRKGICPLQLARAAAACGQWWPWREVSKRVYEQWAGLRVMGL